MRHMGGPRGEKRVCPRCTGDSFFRNEYPSTGAKGYVWYWETTDGIIYSDCPYCAGLGYKEACY